MEEDDEDVHFCLICNKTVQGLPNYINHKKNECSGRKNRNKIGTSLQNSADCQSQFQSFTNLSKQTESINQNDFGVFTSITNPHSGYHDNQGSFLNTRTTVSVGETIGGQLQDQLHGQLQATTDEYKKVLLSTTQSTSQENIFISTHMNLTDTNNVTLQSDALSCSLSPIFSSTGAISQTKGADLASVTEDYGLLSADVSGNRNNIPVQGQRNLKAEVGDLDSVDQIGKGACEQVEDFFQSLELMSKTNRRAGRSSNFNQLPISNILNNLTFSDDEELGFDFGDDMSLDSLSDDEDGSVPPGGHTGGKWKPGDKPSAYKKNRHRYRGKWQPGERPPQTAIRGRRGPSSRGKNITLIPGHKPIRKGRRAPSKATNKIYACNFCNITFQNRFQYSNHCGSKMHKENVFGTRENVDEEYIKTSSESVVEHEVNNQMESGIETRVNLSRNEGEFESLIEENIDEKRIVEGEYDEYLDGYETDEYFEEKEVKASLDDIKTNMDAVVGDAGEEVKYVEVAVQLHICTVCDKKFHNKYMIARHLLTKLHQNRAVAQKEEDNRLIQRYHKCIVRLSPYQCGICRFYFNRNEEFEEHLRSKEHEENCKILIGEIQCSCCRYKTHSLEEIRGHLESAEHVEKIQKRDKICIIKECHAGCKCKFCGLKMHSFERLVRHVNLKHGDGEVVSGVRKRVIGVRNRPKCPKCNIQLASASALALHMLSNKHSEQKPYCCEVCSRAFADRHSYKLHLKSALHTRRKLKMESTSANETDNECKAENETREMNNGVDEAKLDDIVSESEENMDKTKETNKECLKVKIKKTKSSQVEMDDLVDTADSGIVEHFESDQSDVEHGEHGTKDVKWIPKHTKSRSRTRIRHSKGVEYEYSQKDKKSIKCNHCSFTVKDYNDLRPHYMKEHSTQIRICELCDTVFLSEKAYKLHVLSKEHQANIELSGENNTSADKYFQCHVCKKKFTDEKYCKFHTAYQHFHSTTEAEVLKQSGYQSITRDKFADFLKSVQNVGYKQVLNCPECGTAIKKNNLMVHLRNHTNERPFLCKVCPKVFKSNYTLRKHLLKHFGCLERHCDICGKTFHKPQNYEEHMELHALMNANKEKTHICDFCGQAFYVERQLVVHLRRHRKKDLKCDFAGCHWTFAFQHELNAHKRTHSNDRKYLCDTCGFAAYEKYHLRRHEKIHNNERKHHCEYCTYKAGNKTHLRRHMRIHIGSKPFKCPYCNFACNTHENIRKHILETKKHDGLKVYPCKFCSFGTNNSKEFRGHLMSEHAKESDDGARQMPLSVFTGLFQKEEDLARPAEGTKIIPCKERKLSKRKDQQEQTVDNDLDEDRADNKSTEHVRKNKRKRKPDTFKQFVEKQMACDLSVKEKHLTFPPDTMKTNYGGQLSQPYPASMVPRATPSPPYVEPYQRFPALNVPTGVSGPLDLGVRSVHHGPHQLPSSVPNLAGPFSEPGFMKVNYEEMMQYHDYSTKYGVSRNQEDTESNGNLIIDMNYSAHHS